MTSDNAAPSPIVATTDLRDMLRRYLIERSLGSMQASAQRRTAALATGDIATYRQTIREAVRAFYGDLPVGPHAVRPTVIRVSQFDKRGYRLENVLFDTYPEWQVNATVYVPLDYAPPYPAVVIPVGHSGKQFESYQLPAQFFARCGYLALLFDPPGQAGEKQPGNDHFHDGVRCYLVGETSSQYFVADALRCIDYLETREDVDLSDGVAMTGVSGGGTTTTFATLLDARISVTGPSCCLSPLAQLDITQCYAGCPETHMTGRYAEGIDEVDLLCAASPTPVLLMAGALDEVFHIDDTRRLAGEVQRFYNSLGRPDRFEFFVDDGGHAYSLAQARRFVSFMNRWLLGKPDRSIPDLSDASFALDPYPELQCHPRPDVNMRTLTLERAGALEVTRSRDARRVRAAASALVRTQDAVPTPQALTSQPFQVWTHMWQQILLRPEPGIELPATFVYPILGAARAVLHLDDRGRNRLLYRHGPVADAVRFIQREASGRAAFCVDLRGWGDTAPAMYPYEMAGWGGIDRYLAYTSAALGDPLMSMRVRDALATLAYLRTRPEVVPGGIIVSGCGNAGIVALHTALIDGQVGGVIVWDCLVSFRTLLETEAYTWPADTFVPGVLLYYDLPDLVAALTCPVKIVNPRTGAGAILPARDIDALNHDLGMNVYTTDVDAEGDQLASALGAMLDPGLIP